MAVAPGAALHTALSGAKTGDHMTHFDEGNSDFYDLEYFLSMEYRYLSHAHCNRVNNILSYIGPLKHKRVLDLGCGGGFFTQFMYEQGAEITGVDYASAGIVFGKDRYPHLDLRVVSAYELDRHFEPSSFDAVTLIDVIEHMSDHDKLMSNIRHVLKPDGQLVISTDAEDSLWLRKPWRRLYDGAQWLSADGRAYRLIKQVEKARVQRRSYHTSHINQLTTTDLRNLVERYGFVTKTHRTYPIVGSPLRDFFLRLLPPLKQGEHQCIVATEAHPE